MTARLAAALLVALALTACKTEVVCTSVQVTCDGECVSLSSDPRNCGACGFTCATGETCSGSQCCQGAECSAAVYAACYNGNAVQGATAALRTVGAPVPVETGPISLAWEGASLWVANSGSNTLDRMTLSLSGLARAGTGPTVAIPTSLLYSDLEFLAESDGLLYASNAAVGSLVIVDPATAAILDEVQLGAGTFPQGIAFAAGKAYVSLNGTNAVAVVDLATRTVSGTVDLAALASAGKVALPSRLLASGSRVYVTLWNLDSTFSHPGNGLLAVIDSATDALAGTNPLDLGASCQDPGGLALLGGTLWVTCGFFPYDATSADDIVGAAFVPVDLSGAAPVVGAAVPALDLSSPQRKPFAPGALAFCGGLGYVGDRFSGNVFVFDPASRSVTVQGLVCAPTETGSSFVADVACGR